MQRFFIRVQTVLIVLFFLASCGFAEPVRSRALFIGDIMVHRQQLEASERGEGGKRVWDFSPQFRRVLPLFQGGLIVGNLETTFSGAERGYAGYPSFNTPDSLADALKELGVSLVTLANNHIFDRGAAGARRTVEVLNRKGISWTGLGLDSISRDDAFLVEKEGLRWAFINFSYGSNRLPASSDVRLNVISEAAVKKGLERARALSPDVIVACFHWGTEYRCSPSDSQKKAAQWALEGGAQLVVGTHPHVLQPVEVMKGRDGTWSGVVWSLGNFVSFQRTLPRERTCVLAAEFEKEFPEAPARLVRLSAAPLQVILSPSGGRRHPEVVYAGQGGSFNHAGLSAPKVQSIRKAGQAVLDFLGAGEECDALGFYTLWSEQAPQSLPVPRRSSPLN